jgi:hypothetical protein
VGTPVLHPTNKDPSVGTPVLGYFRPSLREVGSRAASPRTYFSENRRAVSARDPPTGWVPRSCPVTRLIGGCGRGVRVRFAGGCAACFVFWIEQRGSQGFILHPTNPGSPSHPSVGAPVRGYFRPSLGEEGLIAAAPRALFFADWVGGVRLGSSQALIQNARLRRGLCFFEKWAGGFCGAEAPRSLRGGDGGFDCDGAKSKSKSKGNRGSFDSPRYAGARSG